MLNCVFGWPQGRDAGLAMMVLFNLCMCGLYQSTLQQNYKITVPCCRLYALLQDMDEFMRVVKSKAKPMAVGGTLISGTLMAALASAYVKAVNEGKLSDAHWHRTVSACRPVSSWGPCSIHGTALYPGAARHADDSMCPAMALPHIGRNPTAATTAGALLLCVLPALITRFWPTSPDACSVCMCRCCASAGDSMAGRVQG